MSFKCDKFFQQMSQGREISIRAEAGWGVGNNCFPHYLQSQAGAVLGLGDMGEFISFVLLTPAGSERCTENIR